MRILLDEKLARKLRREQLDHEVATVQERGWAGIEKGELLRRAVAAGFTIFMTADRNLPYQQNIRELNPAVVLAVSDTKLRSIQPLILDLLARLASDLPFGTVAVVGTHCVR